MARPRSGDWLSDEIGAWRSARVDQVVSLLEVHEVADLALQKEPELCAEAGIRFWTFPIVDRGTPDSPKDTRKLARDILSALNEGQSVAIHCRAGIGRSSLIAACILVLEGATADQAFERISLARGLIVPDTDAQRDWLEQFASSE
jgi:protein-tyrosine phosphatase